MHGALTVLAALAILALYHVGRWVLDRRDPRRVMERARRRAAQQLRQKQARSHIKYSERP